MKEYNCYVLMSFDGIYDFVYEAIIEALDNYSKNSSNNITSIRAAEYLETQTNKLEEIKYRIRSATFVIIDFSELSPNVMWEFGFCQCLRKHIIPIRCKNFDIPFSIQGTDFIDYTLSKDGINNLKTKLIESVNKLVSKSLLEESKMIHDHYIAGMVNQICSYLEDVNNSSLTRELVVKEMERLSRRVRDLRDGTFVLRNKKPRSEVIDYYCHYIDQLKGNDCEFLTVGNCEFWKEITDLGNSTQYMLTNGTALKKGATIKRVFILNNKKYHEINHMSKNCIYEVLVEHQNIIEEFGEDCIFVRIILTKDEQASHTFKNFGILRKCNEYLLFSPKYDSEGNMVETGFTYSKDKSTSDIINHVNLFDRAISKGLPLNNFKITKELVEQLPVKGLNIDN